MPRSIRCLAVWLTLALAVPIVGARDVREAEFALATTNVTVTTTTEAVAVSSGTVKMPSDSGTILVIAWGQLTTGAGTTAVTPRIRRGTTTSGTLVGEALAEEVKAAAGSDEPFFIAISEDRSIVESVEYSLTLEQAGATGNGTILQAAILVLVL